MKLWIARDFDKSLWLYDSKPKKGRYKFKVGIFTHSYRINGKYFPEVTFENSPQEVEFKLIEK